MVNGPGKLFEELAQATWHRLADGERFKIRQGETAITDHLLLELARIQHPGIRIVKTPQDQEDSKGTDWEWWVGNFVVGWLRYAIQAKRLDLKSGRYPNLGHKVGKVRQVEILERFATTNHAIPLYCFYNSIEFADYAPYWHCHRPLDPQQLGCSIATLPVVKSALKKRGARNFDWIHTQRHSLPWRCLVRCPAFVSILQPSVSGSKRQPTEASEFFGVVPRLYPTLPRDLLRVTDFVVPQEIEGFDPDFYNAGLGLYPKRIAVVTIPLETDSSEELRS